VKLRRLFAFPGVNREHQPPFADRQIQPVGTGRRVGAGQREDVFLKQIEDRDLALVLDIGRVPADGGLIQGHFDETAGWSVLGSTLSHGWDPWSSVGPVQPDFHRAGMGLQPLGLGKGHGSGGKFGETFGCELQD
jgi:hypothetical protein